MATKIRSSQQLYIDANLDFLSQKGVNLQSGTIATDAVNKGQMDTAITNAVSGLGSTIHVPVQDLAASKAVASAGRADKMIMLIENMGLYRFDAESVAVSNDGTVIRPTDVASDAAAGRWIKMSSTLTDHDLLSNILGNGTYHLSLAERDKLTVIAAGADVTAAGNVGTAISGTAGKALPIDADSVAGIDSASGNALTKFTWANIKSFLKTYFDTLYEKMANKDATGGYVGLTLFKINFKNVANTFTSFFTNTNTAARTYTFQDKDGTIADLNDVTAATNTTSVGTLMGATAIDKLVPIDADHFAYSDSTSSNILRKFTWLDLKKAIWAAFTGDATVSVAGVITIGANKVDNTKTAQMATMTIKGNNTGALANAGDLSIAQVKTMLGLNAMNLATKVTRATVVGTIDGSNVTFTVPNLIIAGTEEIWKNGLLMNAGAGNDYTIVYSATTTITFLSAPSSTPFIDTILISYYY